MKKVGLWMLLAFLSVHLYSQESRNLYGDRAIIKRDGIIQGNLVVGSNSIVPSAVLNLVSSEKGVLLPRMTQAQRDLIISPEEGLIIYNLDSKLYNYYSGTLWVEFVSEVIETDPIFTSRPVSNITTTDIDNWNTAYSWGNHGTQGYLTTVTEVDPVFSSSPAFNITSSDINNWNTAYGWGDHSSQGYLTTEVDGSTSNELNLSGGLSSNILSITDAGGSVTVDLSSLANVPETDPVFDASAASTITNTQTTNWDDAYSWGNHASAGYLTTEIDGSITNEIQTITQPSIGVISLTSGGSVTITESDPIFASSPAASITNVSITNWNTAYGWGDHSTQGYLTTETQVISQPLPGVISITDGGSVTITGGADGNGIYSGSGTLSGNTTVNLSTFGLGIGTSPIAGKALIIGGDAQIDGSVLVNIPLVSQTVSFQGLVSATGGGWTVGYRGAVIRRKSEDDILYNGDQTKIMSKVTATDYQFYDLAGTNDVMSNIALSINSQTYFNTKIGVGGNKFMVGTSNPALNAAKILLNSSVFVNDYLFLDKGYFYMGEIGVAVPAPPAGYGVAYPKTDGKLYYKNSGGTEYKLTQDGITEVLTFGGGSSGQVATITVTNGLITSRTLVP